MNWSVNTACKSKADAAAFVATLGAQGVPAGAISLLTYLVSELPDNAALVVVTTSGNQSSAGNFAQCQVQALPLYNA